MIGWVGVDLDGTLARYDSWRGAEHIGDPIEPMMDRVRHWLAAGIDVRIFTARVACDEPERGRVTAIIQAWLERHGLPALAVTCIKDYAMMSLWDDRCVQVVPNTGERADGKSDEISFPKRS